MKNQEDFTVGIIPSTQINTPNILKTAGISTLKSETKFTTHKPNQLFQEIHNHHYFVQLSNQTTSFVDSNGKQIDFIASKYIPTSALTQTNPLIQNSQKQRKVEIASQAYKQNHFENETKEKLKSTINGNKLSKKNHLNTNRIEYEYDKIVKNLHESKATYGQLSRKPHLSNRKQFLEKSDELEEIEDIISEIQQTMTNSLSSLMENSTMKKELKGSLSTGKKEKGKWKNKDINTKFGSNNLDKLDEMLFNYKIYDDQQSIIEKLGKYDHSTEPDLTRRQKAKNTFHQIKQYQEISQIISEASQKPTKKTLTKNQTKTKGMMELENIYIFQINWLKLPIILGQFNEQNEEIYLSLHDYPEQSQFIEIFQEKISKIQRYRCYSVFNHLFFAGINENRQLMSVEKFKETWTSEFQLQIEQHEQETLAEFDLTWYQCLVQYCFNHSLEEILVKNVEYDIDSYEKLLGKINGGRQNDKNSITINHNLRSINFNKLKYLHAFIHKTTQQKSFHPHQSENLIIAVIPNIFHQEANTEAEENDYESLKEDIKEYFKGGLYHNGQSSSQSMAVVITLEQSNRKNVEKLVDSTEVTINSLVKLIVNTDHKTNDSKCDKITISKKKSSHSNLEFRVQYLQDEKSKIAKCESVQETHFVNKFRIVL